MRTTAAVLRAAGSKRPYTTTSPLGIEQLALDAPGAGELLVNIRAAGVCHSDLSVVTGHRVRPLPMALGHEAAGVVADVGPGVSDVAVGDHVVLAFVPSCGACGYCEEGRPALCEAGGAANAAGRLLGGGGRLHDASGTEIKHHLGVSGFAEYAVVDRSSAVVVDKDVPFDVAAVLGCAMLTGFGAVRNTAGVSPGESVAVLGLGGVGQAAVLGAVSCGAWPIVAVDPVADKRALAVALGATHACEPGEAEGLLRELTGGGSRWVFEAAGISAVMEHAFALTRRGGTAVSVGLPAPDAKVTLPALAFAGEAKTFAGSYMGSSVAQRDIPLLIGMWREGKLPVERLVSGVLPLQEINTAFEELAAGRAVRQLLHPGEEPGEAR
ncbi:alcohol dehydrogenase catalytic domain-containing protein [Streptomyces melanosporofaciens]|uniref:Zn-dependent alcohol dehydrogenase n=1 Tax=Streptomyces melanosporofaciens TaxID=67327 RepID=A0A1H5C9T1_STRMJ|nr:alcohol dehydrogenase catalytic domain-containing protein [Streptomyces melanosporofaciens]SED63375.1 Zn-dependent alcohol dehydrogenase [Streptomyces melanosporofaciens]